jgi:hypothetical protein
MKHNISYKDPYIFEEESKYKLRTSTPKPPKIAYIYDKVLKKGKLKPK